MTSSTDSPYRSGSKLSSSILIALLGAAVCIEEVGIWWVDLPVTFLGIVLVIGGVGAAARELAKPCSPVEPDHGYTGPRVLRDDETGRAS